MPTVWVSGARGFIGRHLAKGVDATGAWVAGVGHGHWPAEEALACGVRHWVNGEVAPENLDRLLELTGIPDSIYHLAGGSAVGPSLATPLEDFERTTRATARLLEWVRVRSPATALIVASSAAVYGAGHTRPIGELAPLSPFSPYGFHKAAMELIVQSYASNFGIRAAVVRIFSAYGAGLRKQLFWDLCSRLARRAGGPLMLDGAGTEVRDWIHIADVVRLLQRAAAVSSIYCPVLNGGCGTPHTVAEAVGLLARAWGNSPVVQFSGKCRPGDPDFLVADTSRLHTLGFQCAVRLEEGLAEYVRWYRAGAPVQ